MSCLLCQIKIFPSFQVFRHSERDKRDLRGLEGELDRVQKELKAVQEERERKAAEGMEMVKILMLKYRCKNLSIDVSFCYSVETLNLSFVQQMFCK